LRFLSLRVLGKPGRVTTASSNLILVKRLDMSGYSEAILGLDPAAAAPNGMS
jgi:hypothetical protein